MFHVCWMLNPIRQRHKEKLFKYKSPSKLQFIHFKLLEVRKCEMWFAFAPFGVFHNSTTMWNYNVETTHPNACINPSTTQSSILFMVCTFNLSISDYE